MNAKDDDVRYSSHELFHILLEFLRDKRERQRISKLELSPHRHASPVIVQFLAYVRNRPFEQSLKAMDAPLKPVEEKAKRRHGRMFGEPTDGTLFTEPCMRHRSQPGQE
jgi:hypothetical protein